MSFWKISKLAIENTESSDFSTLLTDQFEFTIVAPGGDVVAIVGNERSDFSHARLYREMRGDRLWHEGRSP